MDSPSRPRKRGFEVQLHSQIENSEPDNTKRSNASPEYISKPIPAGDLKQQNGKRLMMAGQPYQQAELSSAVAHESGRQDSQTPFNRKIGQDMNAVPILTTNENHNGQYNPFENHALQDYQMQVQLLNQQNKKRTLMAREEQKRGLMAMEEQDPALRTITSLPDQLNSTHTCIKELLENLPACFKNIHDLKCSVPKDIGVLEGCEEKLLKKEAEINALETSYNQLIQMTPEPQQGELRQLRDKATLTMQNAREKLRLDRDDTVAKVEGKNQRIEALGAALGRSRELVPELIEDLIKLAPKLLDANGQF